MKDLLWLASYPKSGNTWLRIFFAQLESSHGAVSINELKATGSVLGREIFRRALGFDSARLDSVETECLMPAVLAWADRRGLLGQRQKTHSAYRQNRRGEWLHPEAVTRGAIVLVRNPLDVAVSYAHHNGCSLDRSIEMMEDESHGLREQHACSRLGERLGSWRSHVEGWLTVRSFPCMPMRYEDMVAEPLSVFPEAARFAGLPHDPEVVARALDACRFDRLQEAESREGFREKAPRSKAFFRSGRVGDWRNHLSAEQRDRLIRFNESMMTELGYLSPEGELRV